MWDLRRVEDRERRGDEKNPASARCPRELAYIGFSYYAKKSLPMHRVGGTGRSQRGPEFFENSIVGSGGFPRSRERGPIEASLTRGQAHCRVEISALT